MKEVRAGWFTEVCGSEGQLVRVLCLPPFLPRAFPLSSSCLPSPPAASSASSPVPHSPLLCSTARLSTCRAWSCWPRRATSLWLCLTPTSSRSPRSWRRRCPTSWETQRRVGEEGGLAVGEWALQCAAVSAIRRDSYRQLLVQGPRVAGAVLQPQPLLLQPLLRHLKSFRCCPAPRPTPAGGLRAVALGVHQPAGVVPDQGTGGCSRSSVHLSSYFIHCALLKLPCPPSLCQRFSHLPPLPPLVPQEVSLNYHMKCEQYAHSAARSFFNFNGTAGGWAGWEGQCERAGQGAWMAALRPRQLQVEVNLAIPVVPFPVAGVWRLACIDNAGGWNRCAGRGAQ